MTNDTTSVFDWGTLMTPEDREHIKRIEEAKRLQSEGLAAIQTAQGLSIDSTQSALQTQSPTEHHVSTPATESASQYVERVENKGVNELTAESLLSSVTTALENTSSLIIYSPSEYMTYYIRQVIRNAMKMHRDFILTPENAKDLAKSKQETNSAPLLCERWLIHINMDDFSKKELAKALEHLPGYGVVVYWTTKYFIYKQLEGQEIVEKFPNLFSTLRFSSLSEDDLSKWHEVLVNPFSRMDQKLVAFLAKNYRFDLQAVFTLFNMLNSGSEILSNRDIIEAIGIGRSSITDLVCMILDTTAKDDKGKRRFFKKFVSALSDISISYSHTQIKQYMINTLDAFLDLKTLQLLGFSNQNLYEIPENYDKIKLERYRRYYGKVYHEYSHSRLMKLKVCLEQYSGFSNEENLMRGILSYLSMRTPPKNTFKFRK